MGIIGFILSLLAVVFMLVGLVPFLGWLNWFTTLPLGLAGAGLSAAGLSRGRNGIAVAGLVISIIALIVAFIRLYIGCGVI